MDKEVILARISELEVMATTGGHDGHFGALWGAVSLASQIHGGNAPMVKLITSEVDTSKRPNHAAVLARSLLGSLRGEVEAGLVGDLGGRVAGEVLGDFIALAREALNREGPGVENVASVLAAAAFEDAIRRMGEKLAGVTGRPKLDEVLVSLKAADAISGPQVGIAQSYLKFRNDALHADWDGIDRAGIESCLGFVEQLLMKHFS